MNAKHEFDYPFADAYDARLVERCLVRPGASGRHWWWGPDRHDLGYLRREVAHIGAGVTMLAAVFGMTFVDYAPLGLVLIWQFLLFGLVFGVVVGLVRDARADKCERCGIAATERGSARWYVASSADATEPPRCAYLCPEHAAQAVEWMLRLRVDCQDVMSVSRFQEWFFSGAAQSSPHAGDDEGAGFTAPGAEA